MITSARLIAESKSVHTVAGQLSTPAGSRVGGATRITSAPSVCSSSTLLRATREWVMSPTMATVLPLKSLTPGSAPRRCRRMVKASSRAWVGCSWVPSPAFSTWQSIHWEACHGAPEA